MDGGAKRPRAQRGDA